MALVSTPNFPPTFSERNPDVSAVPVYMRLQEHHCVSPQEPVNIGGTGDGFDDGLGNAYFPPVMALQKSNVRLCFFDKTYSSSNLSCRLMSGSMRMVKTPCMRLSPLENPTPTMKTRVCIARRILRLQGRLNTTPISHPWGWTWMTMATRWEIFLLCARVSRTSSSPAR